MDENDKMIFENKNIEDKINSLKKIETLAIFVREDGVLEIFDNESELNANAKKRSVSTKAPSGDRRYISGIEFKIYEHTKEKGTCYVWKSKPCLLTPPSLSVPNLANASNALSFYVTGNGISMDNMISSFRLTGTVDYSSAITPSIGLESGAYQKATVTFYDEALYKGKVLQFYDEINVGRTVSYRNYMSSFGFNDLASSLTVSFHN